jgi:choline-sulfatase
MRATDLGFEYICQDERDELAEVCANYLKQDHDKPFFLVASFINPHDICHLAISEFAEDGFDLEIKNKCILERETVEAAAQIPEGLSEADFFETYCPPLPDNHLPQHDEPEAVVKMVNQRAFKKAVREKWGEVDWRRHRWAYHQLTEQVDQQIGTVLNALRESGLEQNTVVIFTSDHGDHDSSHKLEHKTALYEEATRIPFLICDPDCGKPGSVNSQQIVCNGLDIFPTICDYAGAEVPKNLKGISLKQLARGDIPRNWRDHLLIESEFGYGIRTKDYLYAIYDQGRNRKQLYDLKRDPGQTRNYVSDPDYAEIVERHHCFFEEMAPK